MGNIIKIIYWILMFFAFFSLASADNFKNYHFPTEREVFENAEYVILWNVEKIEKKPLNFDRVQIEIYFKVNSIYKGILNKKHILLYANVNWDIGSFSSKNNNIEVWDDYLFYLKKIKKSKYQHHSVFANNPGEYYAINTRFNENYRNIVAIKPVYSIFWFTYHKQIKENLYLFYLKYYIAPIFFTIILISQLILSKKLKRTDKSILFFYTLIYMIIFDCINEYWNQVFINIPYYGNIKDFISISIVSILITGLLSALFWKKYNLILLSPFILIGSFIIFYILVN